MKKTALNVPNTLSLIRCLLVPAFVAALLFMRDIPIWGCVVPAIIYIITGLTDMLDGKIARKYNAVTDFGKFLDPMADKLLVMGGMLALIIYYTQRTVWSRGYNVLILSMVFSLFIIITRELAVTSLRLICKDSGGPVIAANMAGKIKTVSQMIFIVAALIEPLIWSIPAVTYTCLAIMTIMTIYSGANYFKIYLPLMKSGDDK